MKNKQEQHTVHCLCGSVHMDVIVEKNRMIACHCRACRRWGGGPLLAVHSATKPSIKDSAQVRTFSSSDWAERLFCEICGTHLFYRLKDKDFYLIPIGLFDAATDWPLEAQFFVDEKPDNYNFAETTPMMNSKEVFKPSN